MITTSLNKQIFFLLTLAAHNISHAAAPIERLLNRQWRPIGYVECIKTEYNALRRIEELLLHYSDSQDLYEAQGHLRSIHEYPLHVVARNHKPALIAPLVSLGCDVNKMDSQGNTALSYIIKQGSCDAKDRDLAKELLRCGACCLHPELLNDYILSPGWKTKTWRRMVNAFLMASHPRTGIQSPAQLLAVECPGLFRLIADTIPKHMSMQDRWARRTRKGKEFKNA